MLIEPLCKDRECLVVGSAPCVVDDIERLAYGAKLSSEMLVIGANGGAKIIYNQIGRCDVLATTSHLFQQRLPHERDTVKQLEGLEFQSVWVDTKSGSCQLPFEVTPHYVSPGYRSRVIDIACGLTEWVSTGVWALCLAKVSGAARLLYAGIAPHINGHYGMMNNAGRDHSNADEIVIGRLFHG